METAPAGDVTQLLREWGQGDRDALGKLVPLVQAELRRLARHALQRDHRNARQPTSLVNEAYVRLIDQRSVDWESRRHFFGIAARTMRNIVVDEVRRAMADKRGGGREMLLFDDTLFAVNGEESWDLLALDDALNGLADVDPELSRLVELRFFGGLTVEETAEVLDVSPATVKRSWQVAKIWLHRELERGAR